MSTTQLLLAQGNSGSTHNHSGCVPVEIFGDKNPDTGILKRYYHGFDEHRGEAIVWTIEGAQQVDGVATDFNTPHTVNKTDDFIDVIWSDQVPIGRIDIIPSNPCAQIAQANGGIGGVVLNLGSGCSASIDGASYICTDRVYTYSYNGPNCNSQGFEWTIYGAVSINNNPSNGGWETVVTSGSITIQWDAPGTNILRMESLYNCGFLGACGKPTASKFLWRVGSKPAGWTQAAAGHETCYTHQIDYYQTQSYACNGDFTQTPTAAFSLPYSNQAIAYDWRTCLQNNDLSVPTLTENGRFVTVNGMGDGVYLICEVTYTGSTCTRTFAIFPSKAASSRAESELLVLTYQPCEGVFNQAFIFRKPPIIPTLDSKDVEVQILGVNSATFANGTKFYNGSRNNIQILNNLEEEITIQSRELADRCGKPLWMQQNFVTTKIAEPEINGATITDGSLCNGSDLRIELDVNESVTQTEYLWGTGATMGNWVNANPVSTDYNILNVQNIGVSGSRYFLRFDVFAYNICNDAAFEQFEFFSADTNWSWTINDITLPDEYCAGENRFAIPNSALVPVGSEIGWQFQPLAGTNINQFIKTQSALNLNFFSADFGTDYFGNPSQGKYQTVRGGEVTAYNIYARVRIGCEASDWSAWYSENNIAPDYTTCSDGNTPAQIGNGGNGNANTFSIGLAPNPAHDQVTVQIPVGDGSTATIVMTDAFGTIRKQQHTANLSEIINVADLPLGVYNVMVTKGNDVAIEHLQILP